MTVKRARARQVHDTVSAHGPLLSFPHVHDTIRAGVPDGGTTDFGAGRTGYFRQRPAIWVSLIPTTILSPSGGFGSLPVASNRAWSCL